MMSEAAAKPAPELPPTLEGLVAAQNALLERNAAVMARLERRLRTAIMTQGELNELVMGLHRIADIQGEMRDVAGLVGEAAALRTLEQMRAARLAALAPAPEPEPAPRRHRHRLPAERGAARSLRAVRGLVPVAGLGTVLRHSWAAAHPVATGAIATGAAAAIVTTAAVVPGSPARGAQGPAAGTPAPAASIWSAVPVPSAPSAITRAVTRPSLAADAGASPLTALPPWSPPPGAPPQEQPQDPQQQGQDAQQVTTGTLAADTATLDLGTGYAGTITVTAAGGPVSWGAVRGSDAIALDSARGTLRAGESAAIGITVSAAAQILGGSTTLTLWPGDIKVTVTWPALPVPASGPSPADVPPVLPSAAGS